MTFTTGQILTAAQLNSLDINSLVVSGDVTVDTDTLFVDSTNNRVGIGVTDPDVTLEVDGRLSVNTGSSTDPTITFDGDLDTGIYSGVDDNIRFSTGGVLAMTVDENQRLGVGVAAPGAALEVDGEIRAGNGAVDAPSLHFASDVTSGLFWSSNNVVDFSINGVARFRFTSSDSSLLGNGSRGFSGDTGGSFEYRRQTSTASDPIAHWYSNHSATATVQVRHFADGSSSNRTGTWGTLSDERAKTDVESYGDPRQDLLDIEVIQYNLAGQVEGGEVRLYDSPDPVRFVGYGAQSLAEIKPGMVYGSDAEGWQVKTTVFIPILHRAWQLDHAVLEDLAARVAVLEAA